MVRLRTLSMQVKSLWMEEHVIEALFHTKKVSAIWWCFYIVQVMVRPMNVAGIV